MTQRTLTNRVNKLKGLEEQYKALEKQIEELKAGIKTDMESKGLEEQAAGDYIVRFTTMVSNRFDSKAFKGAYGELYSRYLK